MPEPGAAWRLAAGLRVTKAIVPLRARPVNAMRALVSGEPVLFAPEMLIAEAQRRSRAFSISRLK